MTIKELLEYLQGVDSDAVVEVETFDDGGSLLSTQEITNAEVRGDGSRIVLRLED